jgi:hypothetical protein
MARVPLFVDQVPDYAIRNDHLHINYREIEVVMPVRIFREAMQRCGDILRAHDVRNTGIPEEHATRLN